MATQRHDGKLTSLGRKVILSLKSLEASKLAIKLYTERLKKTNDTDENKRTSSGRETTHWEDRDLPRQVKPNSWVCENLSYRINTDFFQMMISKETA